MRKPARSQPDTNTLIRCLTRDDEPIYVRAKEFFDRVKEGSTRAVVIESVITECIYVLTKIYTEIQSDENYTKVGDKLAIQSSSATIKQPGTEINMKMNLKYQQVRDLFFPSSISSELQMQASSMKTEGKFNIQFQNVQVRQQ
jgi:predicted nucleic-acid-binding protein